MTEPRYTKFGVIADSSTTVYSNSGGFAITAGGNYDMQSLNLENVANIYAVDLSASGTIYVDNIREHTADNGIDIDSLTIKDSSITSSNFITTNNIYENTTDQGVGVDGVLLKDNTIEALSITLSGIGHYLQTDLIIESTADQGVTIDSVLLKNGDITVNTGNFSTSIVTDTITEYTPASGVLVDGVLLKDSSITGVSGNFSGTVNTDYVNELTPGEGVLVDGVLLKDSSGTFDSLELANPDGSPVSSLSTYAEYSGTLDWTGAATINSATIGAVRVGNLVTLWIYPLNAQATSSSIYTSTALPIFLRPAISFQTPVLVMVGSTRKFGTLRILGTGICDIATGPSISNDKFTSGSTAYVEGVNVSYIVT